MERCPALQLANTLVGSNRILPATPLRGKPWRPAEFLCDSHTAENKNADCNCRQTTHSPSLPIVSNRNPCDRIVRGHGIAYRSGTFIRRADAPECRMIHAGTS